MKQFLKSFYIILLDAIIITMFGLLIHLCDWDRDLEWILLVPCGVLVLFNTVYLVEETIKE